MPIAEFPQIRSEVEATKSFSAKPYEVTENPTPQISVKNAKKLWIKSKTCSLGLA